MFNASLVNRGQRGLDQAAVGPGAATAQQAVPVGRRSFPGHGHRAVRPALSSQPAKRIWLTAANLGSCLHRENTHY